MLRKLAYLFLIIFFIVGAIAAYTFIVTINKAQTAAQPIGEFVQQLMIPATPVILPSASTIVHEINDLARLETASVELEKIVTAERNNDYLWGAMGETLIFVANGKVVAGVDLADMTPADIQVVDPTTVMVHIPEAELFDDLPALDNDKSYVADRDTGLLTRADPELETEVRRLAEDVLIEEAMNSGVMEQANYNAQQFMLTFMQGLGFETVIFTNETPPTVEPYVQEVPKGYVLTTPTPVP
ncbi:MAG: DUF4230 domain-containing protein [Ardenticatenaceae bacterium]|nr:DUF4230 domain-containing protein [Anaerolineales bacterium]MCB8977852.1 DUF4230 domain-containing protein [Ardenticatenaceae bacterium]